MGQDASSRDATRGATRSARPRSASASSPSSRSHSRSRSRERASRRSRRSRSTSRSRRSHRSRSRSASRDRGSRRGRRRHHSSRHRDRSRSRERRDQHSSSRSSRKRSRRERSRSTEGRRRRRDSSPRDGEDDRRQRRRRGSDAVATDGTTPAMATAISTAPTTSLASSRAEPQHQANNEPVTQQKKEEAGHEAAEKEDTPTSQDSVATSAATTTVSSQSDVDATVKPPKVREEPVGEQNKEPSVEAAETSKKPLPAAAKVDVKSIKMDILKALADARSTIAGIKGAVPTAPAASLMTPKPASPPQVSTPENGVAVSPERTDKRVSTPRSDTEQPQQPQPAVTPKAMSPQKQSVSSADVDEFDMFSAAELHGAGLPLSPAAAAATVVVSAAVQSNFDDADGYYKPNIGEILNAKYRVMGTVGKGVFSTVLRCQRLTSTSEQDPEIVAIKLIRNNEIMREASQTEIKILTHLSERDPRDKKHCVRLLERFEHRNHVALVFESMQMNVREAMKKFGGKGGISIQAVRIFCKHLLIALTHLEACGIVHADIKPDNVLLDEKQTMIKLCDFGSAFESKEGKHDPTPYLVSRFYRAPEIVLGLPYDKAVDMWSVGCCLYEMFTGKVMFPGATNNEMLKLFMELKGKVPNKIIKKHRQAYIEQFQMEPHFTEENKFCSHEVDRVTGKPVLRLMDAMKSRFDLGSALLSAKSSTDDRKQVLELKNLLERMFTLDATKRITPKEALAHPFVKTEGKQAA